MKPAAVHADLFIMLYILIIPSAHLTFCSADPVNICHNNEKQALLSFKRYITGGNLSSWNAEVDCCSWEGVVCSDITGHVLLLNLGGSGLVGELADDSFLNLTHLIDLILRDNAFHGALPSVANFTKLQSFDISNNHFNSTIPDWIYECKYLEQLSASGNSLQGSISNSVANLTSLYILDLSYNLLTGEIPSGIAQSCLQMDYIYLSGNKFRGDIANAFGNMSNSFLQSLELLALDGNQLSGNLTYQFGEFKRIQFLYLAQNKLSGPIPGYLGKLLSIESLILSDNKFTGNLPLSMGNLFNLREFDVSNNFLGGIVSENHFANLINLNSFFASRNYLILEVGENWIPNFNLSYLGLGSWNLQAKGRIPEWIHKQKSTIYSLDLSNTGIAYDQVPSWLWQIPGTLNLSHNKLSGNIHAHVVLTTEHMDLSSNSFNGTLPRFDAATVFELNLSNNSFSGGVDRLCANNSIEANRILMFLNLEGNMLSGELPHCLMKFRSLVLLNLGNNNISGRIPHSIGNLGELQSLNLFNNRLSGQLSPSIIHCTQLWKIDISNNRLTGRIPWGTGINLPNLNFLILHSNRLRGDISLAICGLGNLRILDLSDNKFSGILPRCMGNLTAMATSEWMFPFHKSPVNLTSGVHESATVATKGMRLYYDTILDLVTNIDLSRNNFSGHIPKELTRLAGLRSLNLSGNHLNGNIPDGIEDMKVLESLDLSNNFLSGKIPHGLAAVSSLNYLDLSYNNLSGEIPQGTQIMTFTPSSFVGNNRLCGPPLTSSCNDGEIPSSSVPLGHEKDVDEGGKSDVEWLYVFVSLGYAVGVSMVCNVLVFKKTWRNVFFEFVDNLWNKLCVSARKKRNMRG